MNCQPNITKSEPEPRPVPKPAVATTSTPVLFVDATGHQCRYPLWVDATPSEKRMVCGAPTTEGASWCVGHSKAVFAQNQGSNRRSSSHGARTEDEASAVKAAA